MSDTELQENRDEELLKLRQELDVCRRRNAELQAELEERRRLLETILDVTPDFFVIKDTRSVYRFVNPAFCRFFGISEAEIIGRSDDVLFSSEDARLHTDRDAEVVRTRKPVSGDWSFVGQEGRFWFRETKTPMFDRSGQVNDILCMVRDISQRKKAETEFERMFNLMPDLACIVSLDGYFMRVNHVWQQRLGYTEEELYSIPYTDLIHPDDLLPTQEQIRKRLLTGQKHENCVNRFRARDGSYHWLEWSTIPFEENVLYAIARDITERILQEQQTRLWGDAFRFCAHGIAIGIPASNMVLTCNEAFARMYGQTVRDIEGTLIVNLYVPEDHEMVSGFIKEADRTGFVSYQARMLRRDGTSFPVQMDVVSVKGEDGVPVYRIATMQDIAEQLASQTALQESEERFRSVVESAPDAIFIQMDGCVEYLNQRAVTLFGASDADEILGRQVVELIHSDSRSLVFERIRQLNDLQHAVPVLDEQILRTDGTSVHVEASAAPFVFSGHHGALVFLRDISQRKQAEIERTELELQLFQSRKIESIGRLAGGIAHDLNNLLTPILGYSEMLVKRLSEPDRNRQHADVIHHAAIKARDLVRQLLAFSSRQALEFRMIDLNEVIRGFAQLLRRTIRADIDIRYHLYEEQLVIQGDASQLEQIIMNLAVNAEDAMPAGGELVMETSMMLIGKEREKFFECMSSGSCAVLTVHDNGEGMDQQVLNHMFEPFFTTKVKGKGTGLGLSMVYGIVRQHGGIIKAESKPGSGTCFRICIPLEVNGVLTAQASEEPQYDFDSKATVLVVEDDEMVRKFVVQTLEEAGFTIRDAESGEDALELLEKKEFVPDMLLTDLVMRGMNGRMLYDKVRGMVPDIRVIYMSGYTKDIISSHGVLQEGLVYLQKPFAVPVLLAKVRDVLQSGHADTQARKRKKPKPKL